MAITLFAKQESETLTTSFSMILQSLRRLDLNISRGFTEEVAGGNAV